MIRVLLIDDQKIVAAAVEEMFEGYDIELKYCSDPKEALTEAKEFDPTVILQDLMMPDVNGLDLVKDFHACPVTKNIPLIVLSSEEESQIKADAFANGANDYMMKFPGKEEFIARIRYHSEGYISRLQRDEAYHKLEVELEKAAKYVVEQLPKPINNPLDIQWSFVPSAALGGDIFGYHQVDDDSFAFYLLDVCGHGVGAALLSVSIRNVLHSFVNEYSPAEVLTKLNQTFPMEKHGEMFFTMWMGVYHFKEKKLTYSSGGHPPALLMRGKAVIQLKTDGFLVGGDPKSTYQEAACDIQRGDQLLIYSDGIYEIEQIGGARLDFDTFVDIASKALMPGALIKAIQNKQGRNAFDDDVSLLQITFPGE